jgi:hypothetical protein
VSWSVRLKDLSDFGRYDANLIAFCSCGHKGVLDAQKVYHWFYCHRWNTTFEMLGLHLRCSKCRSRPRRWGPSPLPPDRPEWMADERDWARLVKRLRG